MLLYQFFFIILPQFSILKQFYTFHLPNLISNYLKSDWEWENQSFRNIITSIWMNSHRLPFIWSFNPISDMIYCSITCTSSTTQFSGCNNCCSSLLNCWNKIFVDPVLINLIKSIFSIDQTIMEIWEHSWTMISPNAEFLNVIIMCI